MSQSASERAAATYRQDPPLRAPLQEWYHVLFLKTAQFADLDEVPQHGRDDRGVGYDEPLLVLRVAVVAQLRRRCEHVVQPR